MTSIYDDHEVVLPSVKIRAWQKHKLYSWLRLYGWSYKRLVEEMIYEIRISFGTADERLANPHRDIHEGMGRVFDRLTGVNEWRGRVEAKTPDHVVRRKNARRK